MDNQTELFTIVELLEKRSIELSLGDGRINVISMKTIPSIELLNNTIVSDHCQDFFQMEMDAGPESERLTLRDIISVFDSIKDTYEEEGFDVDAIEVEIKGLADKLGADAEIYTLGKFALNACNGPLWISVEEAKQRFNKPLSGPEFEGHEYRVTKQDLVNEKGKTT